MNHVLIRLLVTLLVVAGSTGSALADDALRAGRIAGGVRVDTGSSDGDAIAEIGVGAEYGLFEHLTLGAGYTYVDGNLTQEHCLELAAKGYLLGTPLDLFAAAALQLRLSDDLGGASGTLRAGVEWQTSFKLFVGAEVAALIEDAGTGWMGGGFVGVRL